MTLKKIKSLYKFKKKPKKSPLYFYNFYFNIYISINFKKCLKISKKCYLQNFSKKKDLQNIYLYVKKKMLS